MKKQRGVDLQNILERIQGDLFFALGCAEVHNDPRLRRALSLVDQVVGKTTEHGSGRRRWLID